LHWIIRKPQVPWAYEELPTCRPPRDQCPNHVFQIRQHQCSIEIKKNQRADRRCDLFVPTHPFILSSSRTRSAAAATKNQDQIRWSFFSDVRRSIIGSAKAQTKRKGATKRDVDRDQVGRGEEIRRRSWETLLLLPLRVPTLPPEPVCLISCLFGFGDVGCIAPAPERAPARSRANPVPSPTFPRAGPRRPTSGRVATATATPG
jgi:hypothetical protein